MNVSELTATKRTIQMRQNEGGRVGTKKHAGTELGTFFYRLQKAVTFLWVYGTEVPPHSGLPQRPQTSRPEDANTCTVSDMIPNDNITAQWPNTVAKGFTRSSYIVHEKTRANALTRKRQEKLTQAHN